MVATIGNVWANLTVNGAKYVWNDNINSGGNFFDDISPTWTNVPQDGTSYFQNGYYSVSLQILKYQEPQIRHQHPSPSQGQRHQVPYLLLMNLEQVLYHQTTQI